MGVIDARFALDVDRAAEGNAGLGSHIVGVLLAHESTPPGFRQGANGLIRVVGLG